MDIEIGLKEDFSTDGIGEPDGRLELDPDGTLRIADLDEDGSIQNVISIKPDQLHTFIEKLCQLRDASEQIKEFSERFAA